MQAYSQSAPAAKTSSKESPNLDLLRTFAVLFVLFDHTVKFSGYPFLGPVEMHKLGIFGVLLFFVHTALVLMMSLERLAETARGWTLFASFYVRRFFRIYPLAVAFLVFIVALKIPSGNLEPGYIEYRAADAWKFVCNLLLVQNLTHHFRGNIISQYWTLPLELQMYAALPFLFLALKAIRRTGVVLVLWAGIALAAAWLQGTKFHVQILEYVPNFMGGVLAFTLLGRIRPSLPGRLWPLLLAGATAFYVLHPTKPFGWIACAVIGAAIPLFREIRSTGVASFAKMIARYSYGIYIGHMLCIWLAFQKLHDASAWIQWPVYAALLALLPPALYHFIEKPGIALGVRLARRIEKAPERGTITPHEYPQKVQVPVGFREFSREGL